MSGYDELFCFDCNSQIGWLTDCGPRGLAYCNSCKEEKEEYEDD